LLLRDGEIEALVYDLQADLAAALQREAPDGVVEAGANNQGFVPGKYFLYQQLIRRIRDVARTNLPPGATVVVVSRGDEALLELGDGRSGWHFPQQDGGVYAGYYPADDAEAIDHLEELRSSGGEFLLFPETSFWWLEHYRGFREHLEERYQPFVREEGTCMIFALGEPPETEHCAAPVRTSDARSATREDTPTQ
jgi:hypothetical protein